jgi:hypothetical protein
MGIEKLARFGQRLAIVAAVSASSAAPELNSWRIWSISRSPMAKAPDWARLAIMRRTALGSLPVHLEQQPLEIARHLDVHRRAGRRLTPRVS